MSVTQQQLDVFKGLYLGNPQIQALTLADVLNNTSGKTVDWNSIPSPSPETAAATSALSLSLTDCQMNIGYVICDVVLLALGAVRLRGQVNTRTIAGIFHAANPAMGRIEAGIAEIGKAGASNTDRAFGVFKILGAIYSGGCLGAVFSALLSSLTWWDMVIYGISGTAAIVAALASDGVAFVAEVVIFLGTFAFLASDSVKAIQVCGLPAPAGVTDGTRIRNETDGRIYLALDGALRWVPDGQTYVNLFVDWNSVISVPNVDGFLIGTPITEGAALIKRASDGSVFLLMEGGKRWVSTPSVFSRFGFNPQKVQAMTTDDANAIPDGITLW